jgi:hypothetical protein
MSRGLKERKSLSIEPELWKRVVQEASRLDLSVSQVICKALRKHLLEMDELNRLRQKTQERK